MVVKAFAKINLGLSVLSKRKDGYHDIATTFAKVGVFDELKLRLLKNASIQLKCSNFNVQISNDQTNLAYRAAQLLQERYEVQQGVSIWLTKKIPVGAGLGGGSSDAAATLVALNKLWKLKATSAELEQLGAELGSDVPFFIRGGVQAGFGRGEILQPQKLPNTFPHHVVLVSPHIHISTAWAYGALRGQGSGVRGQGDVAKSHALHPNPYTLCNDFEPVVFAAYPELAAIKQQLVNSGAKIALLSGSGSTIFGLFTARPTARVIKKAFPNYTVSVTKIYSDN